MTESSDTSIEIAKADSQSREILIIGGGVIGLTAAYELSGRGHKVTILDRDRIGRQTSWAATGILPPAKFAATTDPLDQLRGFSHELFPAVTKRLQEQTGIDSGFRRCGGWYLAETNGERAAMIGTAQYWNETGIECESVPLSDVSRREPAIAQWLESTPCASAWWAEDECQIRSPNFLRALQAACAQQGVRFQENTDVSDIRETSHRAEVYVGDHWLSADQILVCGGPWTGLISESLSLAS